MNNKLLHLIITSSIAISTQVLAQDTLLVYEESGSGFAMSKIVKEFEKQNNVKVEIVDNISSTEQVAKVQELANKGEKTPDVFVVVADHIANGISSNLISPLSFMQMDKSFYSDVAVDAFTIKNNIYAAPRSIESLLVYYNKDLIEYPYETLNEYEQLASNLNKKGKLGLIGNLHQFYFGYGFLSGMGGYIFGKDSNNEYNIYDIGLNNKGSIEGLEYLGNYIRTFIPKEVVSNDEGIDYANKYFTEGKAAAIINGPWALADYAKSGINYGLAPLPKLNNGKSLKPFFGAKGYVVSSKSSNKELAYKYIQFINQTENALERYKNTAELPPIKAVLEHPLITNDDFANAIAQQIQSAEAMPNIPQMGSVWQPMGDAFYKVVSNEMSAKDALNEAVEKLKESFY